jgi:diguanylate cyclase
LTIAASSRRGLLWGNEEYAVVLPNTALRQALTVADHIRCAVMAKELKKKLTDRRDPRPGHDFSRPLHAEAGATRPTRGSIACEVDPEYAAETQSQVA